jgi:hypothetical protein
MTVAIQSPTAAGEINLASHFGQNSLNSRMILSHFSQVIASVSAFHHVRLTPNRNKISQKRFDTAIRAAVCMAAMKHKFTLNIDEQLVEEIKIQAVREKRTVGEITEQLYREYLDRQVKVKLKKKS